MVSFSQKFLQKNLVTIAIKLSTLYISRSLKLFSDSKLLYVSTISFWIPVRELFPYTSHGDCAIMYFFLHVPDSAMEICSENLYVCYAHNQLSCMAIVYSGTSL